MQVGIDIIEIKRLGNIEKDQQKLKKFFTQNEIEYFNRFAKKIEHVAGFFCAKEAFAKALKCGFGKELNPLDLEILHKNSGAPFVNILKKSIKEKLKDKKIDISISHSNTVATSICIIL